MRRYVNHVKYPFYEYHAEVFDILFEKRIPDKIVIVNKKRWTKHNNLNYRYRGRLNYDSKINKI